jgi:hypothetical protein
MYVIITTENNVLLVAMLKLLHDLHLKALWKVCMGHFWYLLLVHVVDSQIQPAWSPTTSRRKPHNTSKGKGRMCLSFTA